MPAAPRSPFVIAGLVGGVALLILGAAAPGGETYRYLEMPRAATFFALALGLFTTGSSAHPSRALGVLLGTPALACLWDLVQFRNGDMFTDAAKSLAPWLMGGIYAVLVVLATTAKAPSAAHALIAARRRAGGWLVGVGLIALAFTLANRSWLTLENLSQNGTFRSSGAWPDTKIVALVLACIATAFGIAIAWVRSEPNPSDQAR